MKELEKSPATGVIPMYLPSSDKDRRSNKREGKERTGEGERRGHAGVNIG